MSYVISVSSAAEHVREGRVVAFPTETFYGLAARPDDTDALGNLTALKRREVGKPVGLILADSGLLSAIAEAVTPAEEGLVAGAWPGPLTVVFPARADIDPRITGAGPTVAARVPSCEVARELARLSGGIITATSANRSGEPALSTAEQVQAAFAEELSNGLLAGVCSGPETAGRAPSTVVRATGPDLVVLRSGAVPVSELRRWWSGPIVDAEHRALA